MCESVFLINLYKICAQKIVYKYSLDLVTLSIGRDTLILIVYRCVYKRECVFGCFCVCWERFYIEAQSYAYFDCFKDSFFTDIS